MTLRQHPTRVRFAGTLFGHAVVDAPGCVTGEAVAPRSTPRPGFARIHPRVAGGYLRQPSLGVSSSDLAGRANASGTFLACAHVRVQEAGGNVSQGFPTHRATLRASDAAE